MIRTGLVRVYLECIDAGPRKEMMLDMLRKGYASTDGVS
jgi:hypothetical protein